MMQGATDRKEPIVEGMVVQWQPIVVVIVMMVLDIITGFAGAAKDGAIESGKMREGLWHKAGFIGLVFLAIAWEVAVLWINFDAASKGAGVIVPELPAVSGVCAFIALTELVSVCENLCVLNPNIANLPFIKALKPHNPDAPDITVGVEDENAA